METKTTFQVLYTILPAEKQKLVDDSEWNEILHLNFPPVSLNDIVDTLQDLMAWHLDAETETIFNIMVEKDFPYLNELKQEYPNANYIVV